MYSHMQPCMDPCRSHDSRLPRFLNLAASTIPCCCLTRVFIYDLHPLQVSVTVGYQEGDPVICTLQLGTDSETSIEIGCVDDCE
jgi:hypothetical protein